LFASFSKITFIRAVYLEASMKGDLTIRLDHEGASLACFYNQLVPRWEDDEDNEGGERDATAHCTLKVDAQKLWTCLQWQQPSLPINSCLLGMVENEMLVLYTLLETPNATFSSYITFHVIISYKMMIFHNSS
jgi:hypothetical protein